MKGKTPLQMAEDRKHKEVVKLLREAVQQTAIVPRADGEGMRVATIASELHFFSVTFRLYCSCTNNSTVVS